MSKRVGITAVGIDLGTTYSRVAVWCDQLHRVDIITNQQGNKNTPSCVAWDGIELLVGEAAKNINTVFDVKHFTRSRRNDIRVKKGMALWHYMVIEKYSDKPTIVFEHGSEEKKFTLEEICAEILRSLKKDAEEFLATTVKHAVITVPVYFSKQQRQTTKDAAALAGLDVLSLISEPISAAIAYGFDNRADIYSLVKDKTVLILNFGTKTFDVSLLDISKEGIITVTEFRSDTHMGGEDLDKAMVNYCVQMFQQKEKKNLSDNGRAMMRLKDACEKAKWRLSLATQTCIDIDSLYEGIDFSIRFTRANFENLNRGFFDKCIEHTESCLKDGDMDKKGVHNVVLVGSSTKIPKIKPMLTEFFEREPLYSSVKPEEVVAYGAAVLAAKLGGIGNQLMHDLLLLDAPPLSLGIGLVGDIMSAVIPRNKITEKRFLYTTELDGIPADRAGAQKLKVSFEMDANGNLNVSAVVKCNGNKRSLTIAKSGNLSKDDMEDIMKKVKH